MKIGIITLISESNYGNLLQSYALQTILERMGHKVVTLNRRNNKPTWKLYILRIGSFVKSIVKRFILKQKNILIVNPFVENYSPHHRIENSKLTLFVDKYIKRTKPLRTEEDLKSFSEKNYMDAYVVGSDQIWREDYVYNIEESFLSFLSSTYDGKRIAYAASFGTENNPISLENRSRCKFLLRLFDAVSVRENTAVEICKNDFDVNANWVLDPTMLLNKNDYCNIFDLEKTSNNEKHLLVYILDENKDISETIVSFGKQYGLEILNVYRKKIDNSLQYNATLPSVEYWLRGFYDAKIIITDSFHACVFSIIFNKPFICIGNKDRGMSRFYSLLSIFGLQNRLVDISNVDRLINIEINWNNVNAILEQKRKESMSFLLEALKL